MKNSIMWLIAGVVAGIAIVKMGLIEKVQTMFQKK